jgi:glycosyltransferase 2 family protein
VFRQVDGAALLRALAQAHYLWLLPALVVYLGGYLVRTLRWKFLLRPIKPLPWTRLLPPLILGFTVNNLLPARAGEFVGAYVVGEREGISKTAAFASVVVQRAYDGLVMVLFAVVVLALFRLPAQVQGTDAGFVALVEGVTRATAVVFVCLFVFLFAMITWRDLAARVLSWVARLLPQRFSAKVEQVLHSFLDGLAGLHSWRDSVAAFALSVLAWSGESAAYYCVLRAFGLDLPVYAAIMLMAVINLGIMVPSSPGYIGPFEFFGVGTLLLFGVGKAVSLPCVLVIHSLVWLPITLWGFIYLWTLKLSLQDIERHAVETREER